MPTLRDKFHDLSNWHNKITIASGVMKRVLDDVPRDEMSPAVLLAVNRCTEAFARLERYALGADAIAGEIKEMVYPRVDPAQEI
ncbi:MAG: hypothetical protein GX606_03530 [Elusimicrobia bacterium]|nr:hypothetical protein [Elusimicrobiota bacterium]